MPQPGFSRVPVGMYESKLVMLFILCHRSRH